jgi:hypothetical protein
VRLGHYTMEVLVALHPGVFCAGEAVPQTAPIPIVTRRDSPGLLKSATHSPEASQRHRKCRSVCIKRIVPKGLFQYRTIGRVFARARKGSGCSP